jgi:hypothetical protein
VEHNIKEKEKDEIKKERKKLSCVLNWKTGHYV